MVVICHWLPYLFYLHCHFFCFMEPFFAAKQMCIRGVDSTVKFIFNESFVEKKSSVGLVNSARTHWIHFLVFFKKKEKKEKENVDAESAVSKRMLDQLFLCLLSLVCTVL